MQADTKQDFQPIGITPADLRPGDVIFETDHRDKPDMIHKSIRVGQWLQHPLFNQGHRQSIHAAMIVKAEGNKIKYVEVIGDGIFCKELTEMKKFTYYVMRPTNADFAAEMGRIAFFMYKYLHAAPRPERVDPDALVVSKPVGFRHVATGNAAKAGEGTRHTPVALRHDGDVEISEPSGFQHKSSGAALPQPADALEFAAIDAMPISRPLSSAVRGSGEQLQYSQVKAALSILIPYDQIFPGLFKTECKVSLSNFCSMFVIECMQLAQANLNMGEYVRLEKRSSPRHLEDYLKRHGDFRSLVLPKDHQTVAQQVLELLKVEIEKLKTSTDPAQHLLAKNAECNVTFLQNALPKNMSGFDLAAVILNRTLPILNWPDSLIEKTRVFGLGHIILKSEDLARMVNILLELDTEPTQTLGK